MTNPTEAQTRRELIDPALERAGWDLNNPDQVGFEIPVDDVDPAAWQALQTKLGALWDEGVPYDVPLPAGITDYALYRENGEILAVVEAKKTSIDPRLAVPRAEFYATQIEKRQSFRPFAFMTNGHDTYFWDVGRAPKRLVYGFFSRADLENLLFIWRCRVWTTKCAKGAKDAKGGSPTVVFAPLRGYCGPNGSHPGKEVQGLDHEMRERGERRERGIAYGDFRTLARLLWSEWFPSRQGVRR